MFCGRGYNGLKSMYAQTKRVPQERPKGQKEVGSSKMTNLELTYFLNGPRPKAVGFIYFNQSPLNMMFFISSEKLFSFLRYSQFCPDFFGYIGKQLDKKAKVNFKIYDVANWNTKSYNKHIARYFKK